MAESLAGKVAVVTGGGSGIGAAIVDSLTAEGVTCHAIGRRGPVKLDVSDQPGVKRFVDSLERLDILVCAAADQVPGRRLQDLTPEIWDHLINVNLSGAFYFINAGLQKLRAARGDVVLIGSVSGSWPDPSGPAYQASKAGMSALAAAAGFEEHLNGVRFSTIKPGIVDTPIMLKRPVLPPPEVTAAMLKPEDVAEACLMLLKLPRRAHIPELTIVPTRLQSLGKTNVPNPTPAPE
ncbi:MAG: SDR family NAD(P)-dependent oxidoreductase [Chloroflexi bacterium]|nr:MAG: SDR family NAD(P)-dependent oxidoreductase [Chloroflexota bacterium]TMC73803.1 MAG: SDR family NAD(P)-dependent oxidoreductase [Chloroflexota bacterium]